MKSIEDIHSQDEINIFEEVIRNNFDEMMHLFFYLKDK